MPRGVLLLYQGLKQTTLGQLATAGVLRRPGVAFGGVEIEGSFLVEAGLDDLLLWGFKVEASG